MKSALSFKAQLLALQSLAWKRRPFGKDVYPVKL
jgi:hypothetical protein